MNIYLMIAIISLAASLQAQQAPTAPSQNNGQLSPIKVASLDELKRLTSQQRGNLVPIIFQISPEQRRLPVTDTLLQMKSSNYTKFNIH